MRAVTVEEFGGPEVLRVAQLADPEPGPGEVRVRVRAAPVHPVDVAARAGWLGDLIAKRDRYVLGWDFAGVVDAVGAGVTGFAVGDAVVGLSDWADTLVGTHADLVVLGAAALAATPVGPTPVEAASLPLNGLTARQSLAELDLRPGQSLLVTGAAGQVGGFAVELAVRAGLAVYGLAGAGDEKFLTGLGATFVPRGTDLGAGLRELAPGGVDALLDAAVLGAPALDAVRDGGDFLALVGPATPEPVRGIRTRKLSVHSDGAGLAGLVRLVERGELTLRVDQAYPVAQVSAAHERRATPGVRGAVVLEF